MWLIAIHAILAFCSVLLLFFAYELIKHAQGLFGQLIRLIIVVHFGFVFLHIAPLFFPQSISWGSYLLWHKLITILTLSALLAVALATSLTVHRGLKKLRKEKGKK